MLGTPTIAIACKNSMLFYDIDTENLNVTNKRRLKGLRVNSIFNCNINYFLSTTHGTLNVTNAKFIYKFNNILRLGTLF